jgi:phosphohistidine swiveling domain-containing protein
MSVPKNGEGLLAGRPAAISADAPATYVLPLRAAGGASPALVGEKAERLGRALAAGFPVPDGFVVTTAAFGDFLAPIAGELARLLSGLAAGDFPRIAEAARAARALVARTGVPAPLAAEVRAACAALGADAVAVRSSAPGEDGAERSFAGRFDSFLDVRGEATILDRLRDCFASCFSERAIDAALRAGPGGGRPAMAVIVQRMAPAAHAGILFTRDPRGPRGEAGERMLVELARGSGEKVAQGEVTPARFALDRASGAATRLGGDAEGELGPGVFAALAALGTRAERFFGGPQDIEWAEAEDRVSLLQSRPITGPGSAAAAAAPAPALPREHWTPANSQEALEDPVTPLTYTFLRPAIERGRRAVFAFLEVPEIEGEYMRLIEGRIYFNAAYFKDFLGRVPGIPTEIFDHLIFGEGIGPEATIRFPRPPLELRSARIIFGIFRSWLEAKGRMDRFVEAFSRRMGELAAVEVGRLDDAPLAAHLERVAAELEEAFNLHVLGTAMAGGHHLLLAKFLRSQGLGEGLNAADELVGAVRGMETARSSAAIFGLAEKAASLPAVRRALLAAEPGRALAALPADAPGAAEFRAALADFLARSGHRAEKEAELAAPRWREDPSFVLRLVRRFLEDRGSLRSPEEAEAALRARKRAMLERLEREIGERFWKGGAAWRRAALRALVRWAERYAPYRENLRFHGLRAYEQVRVCFLEIGARLAARGVIAGREQVFFLEADEAVGALRAGAALPGDEAGRLRAAAAAREAEYREWLRRGVPRPAGARAPSSERDGRRFLAGVPVSGGVVSGRARVAKTLDEALALTPGEVLVARVASPAWAPVFFLARGVVLDIGGMLSHCAVVAREYGIPCVVGTRDATALVRTGDEVTVDANAGRVYLAGL